MQNYFLLACILFTGFARVTFAGEASLKDAYDGRFLIGAALNDAHVSEKNAGAIALITSQFNSLTPENATKWAVIHPAETVYDFDKADRYVAFGEKHGMAVIGHTLVWHEQTPRWVFQNADGSPASRDTLLARMREHIFTVVGRYKGRIKGWDVVNEALNEDGTLRDSPWWKIIGDDYIIKAFEFAHEADPDAELYYNDFSLENPAKRKGAVALLSRLKAGGAQIAGVGIQGHVNLAWPDLKDLDDTISAFERLGLKVMITELDVDVLPSREKAAGIADITRSETADDALNPYVAGLPEDMQQKLARRYAELFGIYLKHAGTVTRVTLWGVTDNNSWLNHWPIKGRANYPLLFDRESKPKPAFDAVIKLGNKTAGTPTTGGQQTTAKRIAGYHWVGTWAASAEAIDAKQMPPSPPGLADTSLRQIVRVSTGGKKVRVRFSNAFAGSEGDLKIIEAQIAVPADGNGNAIKAETSKPLVFRGEKSVSIPRGWLMISDPVDFDLAPGSDLAITIYINGLAKGVTGHRGARAATYITAGNAVAAKALPGAEKMTSWYYLCGVDVLACESSRAVVCLGDSITDGYGITENSNRRWPDYFARRLQSDDATRHVGVLNQGIGGNGFFGGLGQAALIRLERDVLAQPGVRWLILLEGINDLGSGKITAEQVIMAMEQVVLRARERGLRVYGGTILPCGGSFYDKPEVESRRRKVNEWIRTSGAFDAVIDFDAALRDPEEPFKLIKAADSGDHLHPSEEGYRMMAGMIDLDLFKN